MKNPRLNFGKYRGETVAFVMAQDPSYIGWALSVGRLEELDDQTKAEAISAKTGEPLK